MKTALLLYITMSVRLQIEPEPAHQCNERHWPRIQEARDVCFDLLEIPRDIDIQALISGVPDEQASIQKVASVLNVAEEKFSDFPETTEFSSYWTAFALARTHLVRAKSQMVRLKLRFGRLGFETIVHQHLDPILERVNAMLDATETKTMCSQQGEH